MQKKILYLDLCGTIVKENTTFDFLYKFGYINKNSVRYILLRLLYKIIRVDLIRKHAINSIAGVGYDILIKQSREYISMCSINSQVMTLINEYRRNGYEIIIVSASLDFIVSGFAEMLNVDQYHGTELEYIDKICTGIIVNDLLDAKEKVVRVPSCKDHYVMISDNFGDMNVMRGMSESIPVVYNYKQKKFWLENGFTSLLEVNK